MFFRTQTNRTQIHGRVLEPGKCGSGPRTRVERVRIMIRYPIADIWRGKHQAAYQYFRIGFPT